MEIKDKIRPYLPHILALVLFTVVSFAYFYPVLEGKVLRANDSMVSTINAKEIRDFRAEHGKEPLWTNSIFSGMPAYLISTLYPGNLFKKLDTILRIFKMPVSVLFLSMAGFYVLLLIFGVNPWLSVSGALAYGLSSFMFLILAAGHNTQAIAIAYMAPMIGGIYYAYRYNALKGALFTAIILTLEIQANHPQITYYALLCLLVFVIVEAVYAIKSGALTKFFKTSAILIIPFIIAVGINFANLYSVYEYGKFSIRGKSDLTIQDNNATSGLDKNYITYWSYGVDETLNLFIPDFKGGSSKPFDRDSETFAALRQNNATEFANQIPKYWGTQPGTDGPHYVGAIVFFLFILGMIIIKGPEKWWLLIATILSVMLAWGKNFMPLSDLFIDYFPGYNKFRAVTMILVIAQLCIPLAGFIALRDIFNGSIVRKEIIKGIKIAGGLTCGLLLILLIFPGIAGSFLGEYETGLPDWLRNAIVADRKDLLITDSFRSLFFIVAGIGVLLAYISGKLKKNYSIILITLLISIDLWSVDKRYLNADRFERPSVIQKTFTPSVADAIILKDQSIKRVLNMGVSTFNDNSPTSYFHHSIGGYHGAKLKRYQELIDSSISVNLSTIQTAESLEDLVAILKNTNAINMLNTKYIIVNPEAAPLLNPNALGNAWFVENPVIVDNADHEISEINNFNPAREALIDIQFKDDVPQSQYPVFASDTIWLDSYKPNELIYRYSASEEKLVVFSEIYYPAGWNSYIDGTESSHFRTNYLLRGMVIPSGEHEIRFTFEPASYIVGNKISLASSIVLILLILGYFSNLLYKRFTA